MSKYENYNNIATTDTDIDQIIVPGETIIWKGKPKKSAFIINKIIGMLPFALLWLLFDSFFIITCIGTGAFEEMKLFFIGFFAFHLMPVWIWLSNVLTANRKWKNTEYMVTDKRIIIKTGFIGAGYNSIYYTDIGNVSLKVGAIDKMLGVGDIYFHMAMSSSSMNSNKMSQTAFLDIEDAYEIYPKLQKVVLDIQTDIQYPNELRPDVNNGYNTKYNAKF